MRTALLIPVFQELIRNRRPLRNRKQHTGFLKIKHSLVDKERETPLIREKANKVRNKEKLLLHATEFQLLKIVSVQFSSVAQSCPTLCDPINHSTPGLTVHHQLPEFTKLMSISASVIPFSSHLQSSTHLLKYNLHIIKCPHSEYAATAAKSLQSCPTLCDPMNRSMPGLTVHHQLPEFTQTLQLVASNRTESPAPAKASLRKEGGFFPRW